MQQAVTAGVMGVPSQQPPAEPPSWEAVTELLRDDLQRGFRIDIETDSTIALDEQQDKEDAMELLNVAAPYFEKMAMAAASAPMLLPLMGETFRQVMRCFKRGRNVEDVFDQTLARMQQTTQNPRPDPEAQKLQLEAAKVKMTLAAQQQKAQADIGLAQQKAQNDQQIKSAEMAGPTTSPPV